MVAELARSGFIEHVLPVGSPFPDMALPTAEGATSPGSPTGGGAVRWW